MADTEALATLTSTSEVREPSDLSSVKSIPAKGDTDWFEIGVHAFKAVMIGAKVVGVIAAVVASNA
jgi:hypothetical protein